MSEGADLKQSASYWQTSEIPLNLFVKIADGAPLNTLVISGTPSPEQLAQAWESIKDEYSQEVKSPNFDLALQLSKRTALFSVKATMLSEIAELSDKHFSPEFLTLLNKWTLKPATADNWRQVLQAEITRLTKEKLLIKEETERLAADKKAESSLTMHRQVTEVLITASKLNKVHYKLNELTLLEFCVIYKDIAEQAKQINAKNHGR